MNSDCNVEDEIVHCPFCQEQVTRDTFLCPGKFNAFKYDDSEKSLPIPNEILYHYTKIDTLRKILETKKLRGTHYSQLNDWKEIQIGIELLTQALNLWRNSITPDKFDEISQMIADFKSKKEKCYSTSFSTKDDLLSQWRAYTDNHKGGVAIGFYSIDLRNLKSDQCSLLPCSYTTKDGSLKIPSSIFKIESLNPKGTRIIDTGLPELIQIMTSIKHYGYFEEQEWRLVSVLKEKSKENTINRKRYIEYDIDKSMIKEIIISPHGDQEQIHSEIINLKSEGLVHADCDIKLSSIPYRDTDRVTKSDNK